MDNIYVYNVSLPDGIKEMITPCFDGFTIYLDKNLDSWSRQKAYDHAIGHIKEEDHLKTDVQLIEWDAHNESA